MMNLTQTSAANRSQLANAVLQALFVSLIGATLVFAAGFAHSQTLHDAAHDMRHSTGFPCH